MRNWSSPRMAKRAAPTSPNIQILRRAFMHKIKITLVLLLAALFLNKSSGFSSFTQRPMQASNSSSSHDPTHILLHRRLSLSSKPTYNLHPSNEKTASHMLAVEAAEAQGGRGGGGGGVEKGNQEEEEDGDVEPENSAQMPIRLEPRISNWDEQRCTKNQGFAHNHSITNNILLVSGSRPKACDSPHGDHYLLKFIKNKMDYCRLHDIKIFYNMAQMDSALTDYWSKLPLLRNLMLSHPEVEWLWWMDSDAAFTDMAFELPMKKYTGYNLVLHGWGDEVYKKKSWIGLNTGIFLLRNCQWSLDLIDAWAVMGAKGKVRDAAGEVLSQMLADRPPLFEADDQSVLVYLLVTQKDLWESKVYLEYSYCLHGYWDVLVDKFEEMMEISHPGYGDDRWPFVTHFVGCKPCGAKKSYAEKRCLSQMERAFNFADNQVLQQYGFTHKDLSSSKVKRIHRNQLSDV